MNKAASEQMAPGRSLGFSINRLENELGEVFGRRVDLVAKPCTDTGRSISSFLSQPLATTCRHSSLASRRC